MAASIAPERLKNPEILRQKLSEFLKSDVPEFNGNLEERRALEESLRECVLGAVAYLADDESMQMLFEYFQENKADGIARLWEVF